MVQLSFTLPLSSVGPHAKVAEGAAAQLANKMGMDPALVVHSKPMGPDFTFFVVYGRVHHLVDTSKVVVVERDYPLLTPKEANAAIKASLRRRLVVVGACIGTDAHTVGHRRDPQHQGLRGGEGPGVLPRGQGREPRRAGLRPAARGAGPRREGRRGARLPGRHPARHAPAQHPRDVGRVPRVLPLGEAAAAGRRRPALRRGDGRRARRRPRVRPRHHARRGRQLPRAPAHPAQPPGRHPDGLDRLDQRSGGRGPRGPPPLRPLLPRPLRRQPRRRRLQPRAVRRRGDRDVHRHRRRRGPVRVVLRRPVPRARARRRRPRGLLRDHPGREPVPGAAGSRRTSSRAAPPPPRRPAPLGCCPSRCWRRPRRAPWSSPATRRAEPRFCEDFARLAAAR